MMVREGLWSNTILLVNIIISGLVAFGFYMPLVIYLDEMADGEHTYWLDFAVIWALYVVAMVITRALTAAASKTRMRFKNPLDPVGGPLMGLIAAWVLASFILATLHVSPLPKDAFGGKLNHADVMAASALTSWKGRPRTIDSAAGASPAATAARCALVTPRSRLRSSRTSSISWRRRRSSTICRSAARRRRASHQIAIPPSATATRVTTGMRVA